MGTDKKHLLTGVVVAIVVVVGGFFIGYKMGYSKGDSAGYARAGADAKKLDEEAAKQAGAEATKAANPFQAVNPLEGIESNPFQKAKKVLNPFQ